MRVTGISKPQTGMKKKIIRSAAAGGAITASVFTASQAYRYATKSPALKQIIQEYGGTVPYIKNAITGTIILSSTSAFISGMISFLAEKVRPVDPPNAAN